MSQILYTHLSMFVYAEAGGLLSYHHGAEQEGKQNRRLRKHNTVRVATRKWERE
jgi:hypothetical protein